MPKQKGIIKFEGTMGGMTFYKTKDGHLVKEKSEISADKIANDPAFARTRENGEEFGRAALAGKVLRTTFRNLLLNSSDVNMVGRLTAEMVKVLKADATSVRGKRNVLDGELELLTGFDFNNSGKLRGVLYQPYTTAIDRITGNVSITMTPYIPINAIAAPSGTSHFKFVAAAAEIDFESGAYVIDADESAIIALDPTLQPALNIALTLTPNSTKPLFLVFGIVFYQDVNGVKYPLKNGQYNPLNLVQIDGV
ncbi:MAG: hypothetical protein SFY32_05565 [Bacteroidota bacterium]|nr:hypothetical protein [Bacteroidota bacterium]